MKPVALIGGGGHARSIVAMLEGQRPIAGYVDVRPVENLDLPYLGTDSDFLSRHTPDEFDIHLAIGFGKGGSLAFRREMAMRYADFGAATLAAPSAWIAPGAAIGDGAAVMARAVVNRSAIGRNAVINTGAIIEHDCQIGDNVFVGPGAIVCGGVTVGHDCFIGAGAVIRNGIDIAPGTVIGMGAVVTANITEPAVYVGNPAKRI